MWRSLFLAVGICLLVLGLQCLALDKFVVNANGPSAAREVVPPDWAPWSLLSAGAVVILYTFTLPSRIKG